MPHAALALAATITAIAIIALDAPASAQSDDETAGRIIARLLDDGRVEFGWQPTDGERVLPRQRYFPTNAQVDRWLRSSPVEVDGTEIGRINARLLDNGRIEFAFAPTDGERILTRQRYFPTTARPNRWLRSTEITIGAASNPFIAVSAGGLHTCALRENGEIECWGWLRETLPGSFTTVSTGLNDVCAIRDTGEIACRGQRQNDVPSGMFTAISISSLHACAIRDTGEIECWGSNEAVTEWDEGKPVMGYVGQSDAPSGSFTAISAGGTHTCAIRESGAIACWGSINDAPSGSFIAVSAGGAHACAIRENGELTCWGPTGINAPPGSFTAVSAGFLAHTCAIHSTGEIACWGLNIDGQSDPPEGTFTAISAGSDHTCAIRETGEIECWGSDTYGQSSPPTD